jgi:putative membrane protein
MRVTLGCLVVLLLAAPAFAHDGPHPGMTMSAWDGAAILALTTSAALYATGAARLRARRAAPRWHIQVAFWSGWLVMLSALLPPLDHLATQRFAAHMLQHELLMLVGIPLMVVGQPLSTCLWALPTAARHRVAGLLQYRHTRRAAWLLTSPLLAWILHAVVIWVWHVPALYDRAVAHEGLHAVQHVMFCVSAGLFWWSLVLGRHGRAGYGASVFYVFTTAVHTGLLGAVFTLERSPLYPWYARRAPDPLADQQLAGLVMWVPAGLVLTVVGVALFAAWMGDSDRRVPRPTA